MFLYFSILQILYESLQQAKKKGRLLGQPFLNIKDTEFIQ